MRIGDWSADVCSSDLLRRRQDLRPRGTVEDGDVELPPVDERLGEPAPAEPGHARLERARHLGRPDDAAVVETVRSAEHTSEPQALMRISNAVFCLKKKNTQSYTSNQHTI